ncbi:hypothetical protein D3C81_2009480 [compost metagenome]
MVDDVDCFMLQDGLNDWLQKIGAFLTVRRCTHLNDTDDILNDIILARFLLKMSAHYLIICCIEAWRQLVLVQHGREQRKHESFLFGKVKRI